MGRYTFHKDLSLDIVSYLLPIVVPIIILLVYKAQIESKLKFVFYSYLLNLGLGKLISPLAFIPMYLDVHISYGAPFLQLILLLVYLAVSVILIKNFVGQFVSVKNV